MKSGIKECAKSYAKKTGCSQSVAEKVIRDVVQVMQSEIVHSGGLSFKGIFSIEVKNHASHTGRNPVTKETITIPAHNVLKIKTGSQLGAAIN